MKNFPSERLSPLKIIWLDMTGDFESVDHTVDVTINSPDARKVFRVGLPDKDWTLADIVPLARILSDTIIQQVITDHTPEVLCKQGCSKCCRYFISLSIPEVARLSQEIQSKPHQQQEQIIHACLAASKCILDKRLSQNDLNITSISKWYDDLNLACPFLQDDLCSIYDQRPFVCREHFVTGTLPCGSNQYSDNEMVRMPVDISNAMAKLASALEARETEFIALPIFVAWLMDNEQRVQQKWPAQLIVRTLAQVIHELEQVNNVVPIGV